MKLDCYVTGGIACEIVPAPQDRAWMDASPERYPYRCLPLNIANAFGWHILTPCILDIEYTGGPEKEDIRVTSPDPVPGFEHLALSHFKRGILTFHPGYLFRTDPGWQLLAGGPFNWPKDGIAPLTGIIETDWLPFPFTMNWQMTRPGRVRFEKGEPFCQVVPVPAGGLDQVVPRIRAIDADPELKAEFEAYRDRRSEFLKRLAEGEAEARQESWQKFYFRGKLPTGTRAPASHVSKLRLADPVDSRTPPTAAQATPAPATDAPKRRAPLPGLSRRPVPISRQHHEGIAVAAPDYRFAQDAQLLPLGKTEVERASLDFPIVFALDPPVMAAVAGGQPGQNLFVQDGAWAPGTYLPAIVRQYPFTFAAGPRDTPVLCIDEACPWLDRTSPRKLLAGGQLTPLGKSGAAIAEALLRETAAVADFVEALAGRGLLVPAGVNQDHPIAERPSFARLLVVDHVRYGALPASVAEDWRRRGWSALVAAQVRSLGNWRRLAEREAARSAAAAVPPATVSSKEPA
ncbi:hypothetical protein STVA_36170 [Allostella vacuolata]|nr:hypothetical protein STVA_36170 [Stella vacuolata]